MKTLRNNSEMTFKNKVLKAGTFFFLMIFCSFQALAEESLEEAQANAERNELLSYVAMGLGIAAVIVIAITTALKGRKNEDSGAGNVDKPVSHRPFTHKHDHHHGRRGAPLRRR